MSDKISNKNKIFKIYNGYDKSVFDRIQPAKIDGFNIVFTGVLSKNHNYDIFNDALELINPKKNNYKIRLILAGSIDKEVKDLFSKNIHINSKGYVSHEEAIGLIKSSNILVNFTYKNTEETDMLSGKLIEYLATGSPIINFSEHAEESKLILSLSKKSFNADYSSVNRVAEFIIKEYESWMNGNYKKQNLNNLEFLTREKLTKNLIDIINKIKSSNRKN